MSKLTARTFLFLYAIFFSYFFYKNNPDGQQPIKEPSLKYYPFPLLSVSSLIRDHNIFLVGVFFSLLFAVKLPESMFLGRLTNFFW